MTEFFRRGVLCCCEPHYVGSQAREERVAVGEGLFDLWRREVHEGEVAGAVFDAQVDWDAGVEFLVEQLRLGGRGDGVLGAGPGLDGDSHGVERGGGPEEAGGRGEENQPLQALVGFDGERATGTEPRLGARHGEEDGGADGMSDPDDGGFFGGDGVDGETEAAGAEEEIGLGDVGGEEAVEVGGDDG